MSYYNVFTKLEKAKSVPISGLCAVLSSGCSDEKLVMLRGFVQPSLGHDAPVPQSSEQQIVLLQRTHGNITFNGEDALMEAYALRQILPCALPTSCRYQQSKWMGAIPFVLTGSNEGLDSHCVSVRLGPSTHPLPLTRAFHQLEDIHSAFHGDVSFAKLDNTMKPVGVIEDMILPRGKEVTAVGFCSLQNGNPQIVACKNLPYFLSDKTRDEMLSDHDDTCRNWFRCTIVLGSLALGVIGYLLARNWPLWKRGKQLPGKDFVVDVDEGSEKICNQEGQSLGLQFCTCVDEC